MSEIALRFEKAIKTINLRYGLLLPVLISILMGRVLTYFDPSFFKSGTTADYAYYAVMTIGLLLLAVHALTRWIRDGVRLAIFYITYTIALGLLNIFMDPFPTPFLYQNIAFMIAIDLLFGKRWMWASIVYFVGVTFGSLFVSGQELSGVNISLALLYSLGASCVAVLVSKYRTISDQERKIIDKTTKQQALERQRLLSLINNMGEAVIATDTNGKVILYNAAVLNLLDTNQSLSGRPLDNFLKLRDLQHKKVSLKSILKNNPNGTTSQDLVHVFSPGDEINMYINIAPVKLGYKEDLDNGFIILMRDITKEKSLEDERDEFISVVSHELRTPVAIAEGNLSNAIFAVNKKVSTEMVKQALTDAHEQVIFLSNMINDLATLSRAERSDISVEISEVDPAELLHTMAHDYKEQAENKNLKLTVSSAKDIQKIRSSELYLHEVLQNFITNALKYTASGSVILNVRSDLKGRAVFSVADTGIGLSKSDQKRIFEKFFRSEDYRTRESSGTGLGLYVTAKLAHKLNAEIEVTSTLNKGSTFTITVPSLEK